MPSQDPQAFEPRVDRETALEEATRTARRFLISAAAFARSVVQAQPDEHDDERAVATDREDAPDRALSWRIHYETALAVGVITVRSRPVSIVDEETDLGALRWRAWAIIAGSLAMALAAAVCVGVVEKTLTPEQRERGASWVLLLGAAIGVGAAVLALAQCTLARRARSGVHLVAAAIAFAAGAGVAVERVYATRPTLQGAMAHLERGDVGRAREAAFALLQRARTRADGETVIDAIAFRRLPREATVADIAAALQRRWLRPESRARLVEMLRRAVRTQLTNRSVGHHGDSFTLEHDADLVSPYLPAERDRLLAEAALAQGEECVRTHDLWCIDRLAERARSGGASADSIAPLRARVLASAQAYVHTLWQRVGATPPPENFGDLCEQLRSEAVGILDRGGVDPAVPIADIDARCGELWGHARAATRPRRNAESERR